MMPKNTYIRDFFRKIGSIIFWPGEFFEGIRKEKGIKTPLLFFVSLLLFSIVSSLFLGQLLIRLFDSMPYIFDYIYEFVTGKSLLYLVLFILAPFFNAGIFQLVKSRNISGSYSAAYGVFAYSLTPMLVSTIAYGFGFLTVVMGTELQYHTLGTFLVLIWSFLLTLIGISRFYNVSKLSAFWQMIKVGIVGAIITIIILFLLMSFIRLALIGF